MRRMRGKTLAVRVAMALTAAAFAVCGTGCGGKAQGGTAASAGTEAAASPGTGNEASAQTDTAAAVRTVSGTDSEAAAEESSAAEATKAKTEAADTENPGGNVNYLASKDGYELEQMVVLSRHNIRAPLSGKGSVLDTVTPYTWFDWTAGSSELSVRGGVLETEMGQYFAKLLEDEGLISENWQPERDEVRFYANSKQRTIATAQYFSTGMLPTANVEIETHMVFDTMDPVFTPQSTFFSDAYVEQAMAEIEAMDEDGLKGINDALSENYKLLAEVIDFENSEAYADGSVAAFNSEDTVVTLEQNKEPSMAGSLKIADSIADALILQYYESDDPVAAAFGHELTEEQWTMIADFRSVYGEVLFTAPSVCVNVAHPLLQELLSEMNASGRKFSFLCGHDSNIGSVFAALGVEDYELPNAIEKNTPIGSKFVIEKLVGEDGQEYVSLQLVYQSVDQLRSIAMLSVDEPPCSVELSLEGLEANEDGYYRLEDVEERFNDAINAYYELPQDRAELSEAA